VLGEREGANAEVRATALHKDRAHLRLSNNLRNSPGQVLGKFGAESVEVRGVGKLDQRNARFCVPGGVHVGHAVDVSRRKVQIRRGVEAARINTKYLVHSFGDEHVRIKVQR
jgi:hypothetical protein